MRDTAKSILYPLVTLVALVAIWSWSIAWFAVPNYILPSPTAVLRAIKLGYIDGLFWEHFAFTLQSTLTGYAAGCLAGFLAGSLLAESRNAERFVHPYVVALQSMPKVALAPLIIVWFGYDLTSKVIMVALVCFFPVFINTMVGLRQTDPALVDLMRAFSAPRRDIFLRVRLPAAAGHIFAGLQISVVLALIGAVVAEFVASTRGLGYLIKAASVNLEVNVMFAALLSLALMGVLASQFVRFVHRKLIFWDKSSASTVVTE